MILGSSGDRGGRLSDARRVECLGWLERCRSASGGFGPYPTSPPEPFDTAVALLALEKLPASVGERAWIDEGRAYLLAEQAADGTWPATTRPRGGVSYAQETSTSAWAVLALLRTIAR